MPRNEATVHVHDTHHSPQQHDLHSIGEHALTHEITYPQQNLCHLSINISKAIVDVMIEQSAIDLQQSAYTPGFNRGHVPVTYIKEHYHDHLLHHIQEFLLKFYVIEYLYNCITDNRMSIAGDPQLLYISQHEDGCLTYLFELDTFSEIPIFEWKHFPFKSPRRKNYKDIDHQVISFLEEERTAREKHTYNHAMPGDLVLFKISLANHDQDIVLPLSQEFWYRIGNDETESPLRTIFIGAKVGDSFFTTNPGLQHFLSDQINTHYNFFVEIRDIMHHAYFCLEHFKRHFKIKTQKELHQKLIEVFSFRNDISLRREISDECLKLMISKHRFTVPYHLIARQQKIILEAIQENPDYHVYRIQKDFLLRIRQLAEKQLKEMIFIDQFAYRENLIAADTDITSYLNLTHRPRTKEFIHFELSNNKIQGQETPLAVGEIRRVALREKALNHIIHHLTR